MNAIVEDKKSIYLKVMLATSSMSEIGQTAKTILETLDKPVKYTGEMNAGSNYKIFGSLTEMLKGSVKQTQPVLINGITKADKIFNALNVLKSYSLGHRTLANFF